MSLKGFTSKLLWLSLAAASLLSVINTLHIRSFLEQSEVASAIVVKSSDISLFDKTTFRFTSKFHTVLDVESETIQSFNKGDSIPVLYNRLIPAQMHVDEFIELWTKPLLYAALAVLIAGLILIFKTITNWAGNKKKNILRNGTHIYTQFKAVEAVIKVKKDGKHPYQVISSWRDQKANKTYLFKSEYLWSNPIDYIMDQTITVKIDSNNKKKYIMDLSFLPDNIR